MLLQIKAWAGMMMYQRAHYVANLQSSNCAASNAFANKGSWQVAKKILKR